MNAPYRMTSHTHGEEELKPWFEPLKTGTTAVDCALLHALDGAWGARHEAEHTPRRPIADPEWLKAAEGRPLHWDDFIPPLLTYRHWDAGQWARLLDAMDMLADL